MEDRIFDKEKSVKAILVSVLTPEKDERSVAVSLAELERLLDTAGGEFFTQMIQPRQTLDKATYIGKGKLEELSALCKDNDVSLIVFDDELSPAQIKNIEDGIETEVRVIDRSMLILDIFALHAKSGEGKLQVELAQLKYTAPRLYGKGNEMSRLGGGIGTRGPGESRLEKDKRHLRRRIDALEAQLRELENNRVVMRSRRGGSGVMQAAIVGYTNAGKSTLLNRLTDAGILAEDKLFATLDTTTRRFTLPSGRELLLTDTVGFIRNLPHHLVEAFKSTLEEAKYADALIIVVDASDPECEAQLEVTEKLLYDLGITGKTTLYVLNKCDIAENVQPSVARKVMNGDAVAISAKTGEGITALTDALEKIALNGRELYVLRIPVTDMAVLDRLYKLSMVEDTEYEGDHVNVVATLDAKTAGQYAKYIIAKKK